MVLTFTGTNWLLRNISHWRYTFYKICEMEASRINRNIQWHAALAFSQSFFLVRTTTGELAPCIMFKWGYNVGISKKVLMSFIFKMIAQCHTSSITVLFTARRLGPTKRCVGCHNLPLLFCLIWRKINLSLPSPSLCTHEQQHRCRRGAAPPPSGRREGAAQQRTRWGAEPGRLAAGPCRERLWRWARAFVQG